jgi:hypothetical protein
MVMRLWISQIHPAHSPLLRGEPAPAHNDHDIPLTILHIMQEFPFYGQEWKTFHSFGTLRNILGDYFSNVSNIVAFLHGIGVGNFI